jgi:hypothetical protein
MPKKPYVAGIALAAIVIIPLFVILMVRGGRDGRPTAPPTETVRRPAPTSSDPAGGETPREAGRAAPVPAPSAASDPKAFAALMRETVLQGGDLEALLAGAEGDLSAAIRAYLDLVKREEELRDHAKMTQSLASLPDPSGDILRYCQKQLVDEERPVLKLILAQILEERADESSIGAFREVLDQYWYAENPAEAWGVLRSSLRGLGKIGSEKARGELWERFWKARTDELKSEVLRALAVQMDMDVITGIRGVIGNTDVPEEIRIGAVDALASGLEGDRDRADAVMTSVYGLVKDDQIRAEVVKSMAELGGREGMKFVGDRLLDYSESETVKLAAVFALHHYGNRDSLDLMKRAITRERGTHLAVLAQEAADAIRARIGE